MIILDTNVVSEAMRLDPDPGVIQWLQENRDASITAVTVAELFQGARNLPPGRRRELLMSRVEASVAVHNGRVLPFDEAAAVRMAELWEVRRSAGRPLAGPDGMIAAIASVAGAALASRNTADFTDLGLDLIDPWHA